MRVTDRVIHRLLNDAVQMRSDGVVPNGNRLGIFQGASNVKPGVDAGSQFFQRRSETVGFELDWIQSARQLACLANGRVKQGTQFGRFCSFGAFCENETLLEPVAIERGTDQKLAQAI